MPKLASIVSYCIVFGLLTTSGTIAKPKAPSVADAKKHWAYQPLKKPAVPIVFDRKWVKSPIDAFTRKKMIVARVTPAPAAKPRALLRRVYLDLIGLPPTPAEQVAFAKNPSETAYAKVVDTLLARPQYGERWGRHWLDVARYAETKGYERDDFAPFSWRFRDYVIKAFNDDMPYSQFLTEQLAGDELPNASVDAQIATTFLRLGAYDTIANNKEVAKYNQLDDIIGTTTLAFMGQTIQCARCHDHMFEPISQKDYYQLLGAFESLSIGSKEKNLGKVKAWVFSDRAKPRDTHIRVRGDARTKGEVVPFAIPAIFNPSSMPKPVATKSSPGRRLAFAKYLTGPGSHLTARVMANRIWHYHFGKGFMEDPSNFGLRGGAPLHPKLLDYLAYELRSGGWKMKRLHKIIVLSNTYRQSAVHPKPQADLENKLFSRWPIHRLQAEAIRDSILAVSGKLNLKMGGDSIHPPFANQIAGDSSKNTWKKSSDEEASRRSVYVYAKRAIPLPELSLLDSPESTESCGQRKVSTTAVQALLLMNGRFATKNASVLAERVKKESSESATAQVRKAFELVLCRPPTSEELKLSVRFLGGKISGPSRPASVVKSKAVRKYISPVVSNSKHIDIRFDVRGMKDLYLVADVAPGRGIGNAWANWLSPRLIGSRGTKKLTQIKWVSATTGWKKVLIGKSVGGGSLSVKGKKYTDGIGTHAQSIIHYRLPPGYTTFLVRGVNDDGGKNPIRFMIFTRKADIQSYIAVKKSPAKSKAKIKRDPLTDLCLMLLNTNEFAYAN